MRRRHRRGEGMLARPVLLPGDLHQEARGRGEEAEAVKMRIGETWSNRTIVIELDKGDSIDKLCCNKRLIRLLDQDNNFKKEVVVEVLHSFKLEGKYKNKKPWRQSR